MKTVRRQIQQQLEAGPVAFDQLADQMGLAPADLSHHLAHLQRSLKAAGVRLKVEPARCGLCGFVFSSRSRLSPPGRCPSCRRQQIHGPWLSLAGGRRAG